MDKFYIQEKDYDQYNVLIQDCNYKLDFTRYINENSFFSLKKTRFLVKNFKLLYRADFPHRKENSVIKYKKEI